MNGGLHLEMPNDFANNGGSWSGKGSTASKSGA